MAKETVTIFKLVPLAVGQKIRLEGGRRAGDWEVVGVSDRKVRLRCPISGRELEADRFCCFVEERVGEEWPQRE